MAVLHVFLYKLSPCLWKKHSKKQHTQNMLQFEREKKKKHKNFTNQNAAYVGSFMLNHICSSHFGSIKKAHKNVVFTENCCVC